MSRRIGAMLLFICGAWLAGCATGIDHAQAERALATLSPDQGRIYFYREASVIGAAIQPQILLDGVSVGRSQPGGYFVVDVAPGEHVVTSTTEVETKLTLHAGEGRTLYVSSSIGLGLMVGRVSLQLQPEAVARPLLAGLRLTAPSSAAPSAAAARAALPGDPRRASVTMEDLSGLLPPRQR